MTKEKRIIVRHYTGAFHRFMQSLMDWVFSILLFTGFWLIIFWILGEVELWPISHLYEGLKAVGWLFLLCLVASSVFTGFILFFKERGLTIGAWLFHRWMYHREKRIEHVPFDQSHHPLY